MKKLLSLAAAVFIFAMFAMPALAAAGDDATEGILEAVGVSYGLAIYNSHIITGMAADAYAKDVYTGDDVKQILSEQQGGLDILDKYADKLIASPLATDSDKESLRKIKACIAKILDLIVSLENYIDNPTDENTDEFQKLRKESFNALSDLLGLGKK